MGGPVVASFGGSPLFGKSIARVFMALLVAAIAVSAVFFIGSSMVERQQELASNSDAAEAYNSRITPPTVAPTEAGPAVPTVAFIGDSYTAGAGATSADARWSTLVSESQGWEELNLANGGTGYATAVEGENAQSACAKDYCPQYTEVIPAAAEASPAVVIVSGGRNDVGQNIDYASIASFYLDLRGTLPDAEIYAVSPVWDARETPAELPLIADAIRDAVTAVGGTYVDIGQPFAGEPQLITEDDVHPNDDGHETLASVIIAALPAQ